MYIPNPHGEALKSERVPADGECIQYCILQFFSLCMVRLSAAKSAEF